ncbi:MAG: hypothetical protein AAF205_13990, partial [Pseudomonadota bacterium]
MAAEIERCSAPFEITDLKTHAVLERHEIRLDIAEYRRMRGLNRGPAFPRKRITTVGGQLDAVSAGTVCGRLGLGDGRRLYLDWCFHGRPIARLRRFAGIAYLC